MMKLRYTLFWTFRPSFMDFRRSVKSWSTMFLVKWGVAKFWNSGGTFCHQSTTKIKGELRPSSELWKYCWLLPGKLLPQYLVCSALAHLSWWSPSTRRWWGVSWSTPALFGTLPKNKTFRRLKEFNVYFIRRINNCKNLEYWERLKKFRIKCHSNVVEDATLLSTCGKLQMEKPRMTLIWC